MRPTILFDGDCGFCSRAVLFVAARDRAGRYRFASLQSPFGERVRAATGEPSSGINTILLVEGERIRARSDAVLAIAGGIGWPWKAARIFTLIPRPLRDAAYNLIARNRTRLVRGAPRCLLPGDLDGRLLPDDYDARFESPG